MSDAAAQQGTVPGSQPDPTSRDQGQPSESFDPFLDPQAAAAGPCGGSSAAPAAKLQHSAAGPVGGRQAPAAPPSEEALGRPLLPRERAVCRLAAIRRERGMPTAEQALARCQVSFCCGRRKSSSLPCMQCVWPVCVEAAWLLPQGDECVGSLARNILCACEDRKLAAGT